MATPKKIPAEITKIDRIDDKIIVIYLKPVKRVPNFKEGQFLHFSLEKYIPSQAWSQSRVFSIASPPEIRNEVIRIVVSKQGSYTKRIFDECKIGNEVWLKLPYGDFIVDKESNAVLIAGGTGVTPFLSLLNSHDKSFSSKKLVLYYGVLKEEHLFCYDELKNYEKKNNYFSSHFFVEEGTYKKIRKGRLDILTILSKVKTKETKFYLSGPKLMIDNFRRILIENGILKGRIFSDDWE